MMPSFIVIGAMKAGTTSLYFSLKQHPEIFMCPIKEVNFFAFEGQPVTFQGPGESFINQRSVTTFGAYQALFRRAGQAKAIGDVAHEYLYSKMAAARIKHYLPKAKLIAILRHPAERAFSEYVFNFRDQREKVDFASALKLEEGRIRANWNAGHYLRRGFYYQQLKRYYDRFDQEQIKVYLYEDLRQEPKDLFRDLFQFVGVDENFVPNQETEYNVSGLPKSKLLHNTVRGLMKLNQHPTIARITRALPSQGAIDAILRRYNRNLLKPEISSEMRLELTAIYRDDILKLQDLIRRDLSHWL